MRNRHIVPETRRPIHDGAEWHADDCSEIFVVGWRGQWQAEISSKDDMLRIKAGMGVSLRGLKEGVRYEVVFDVAVRKELS